MDRIMELEKANRDLKEASIRCETIRLHILHLEQEIAAMTACEIQIEQNISTLKHSTAITLASEYKKIKEELDKVKNRLVFLRIDKNNHGHILDRAEKVLLESRQKVANLMLNSVGKVIQGKFGKRDG